MFIFAKAKDMAPVTRSNCSSVNSILPSSVVRVRWSRREGACSFLVVVLIFIWLLPWGFALPGAVTPVKTPDHRVRFCHVGNSQPCNLRITKSAKLVGAVTDELPPQYLAFPGVR